MRARSLVSFLLALLFLVGGALPGAWAQEVRVLVSGAMVNSFEHMLPAMERMAYASSQGGGPDSIPERLKRDEPVDLVVMGRASLETLVKEGKLIAGSEVDIARSGMGLAVRVGLPKPDIRTLEGFKKALIEAKSVAYSASVSGTYLSTEVFPRLGIADAVAPKAKKVVGELVGAALVRGEADLGMQQESELVPFGDKIQFVGPLPDGAQRVTSFTAAIASKARDVEGARAVIAWTIAWSPIQ